MSSASSPLPGGGVGGVGDVNVVDIVVPWLILGAKVIGGFCISLASFLYMFQDKMLYIPEIPNVPKRSSDMSPPYNSPDAWDVKGRVYGSGSDGRGEAYAKIPFEDVMLDTPDGAKIHCWLMLHEQLKPTIIYFHGNAGNMGLRLQNAAEMYYRLNSNILMMDYRGYGNSVGTPTEKGLNIDADVVLKYAMNHPKLKSSKLFTFGRSLGGAVSIALAHRHRQALSGLIVENTFLSIPKMVDVIMPFVSSFKSLICRINWDNDQKIGDLTQPLMFIAGEKDNIVPHSMMLKLIDLASNSTHKDIYKIADGNHNDCFEVAGKEYYRRMDKFIRKVVMDEKSKVEVKSSSLNPGVSSIEADISGEVAPVSKDDNNYDNNRSNNSSDNNNGSNNSNNNYNYVGDSKKDR